MTAVEIIAFTQVVLSLTEFKWIHQSSLCFVALNMPDVNVNSPDRSLWDSSSLQRVRSFNTFF